MLIAFLFVSFIIGLFVSYLWSTNGFTNVALKIIFSVYSLWAAALILAHLVPAITASGMRLF